MIRGDARQGGIVHLAMRHVYFFADEDVVYPQERQSRGEGRSRLSARLQLRISKLSGHEPVGRRPRRRVEVARQDHGRLPLIYSAEPTWSQKRRCLADAFGTAQSEVCNDDLKVDVSQIDFHPERPSGLSGGRQGGGFDQAHGQGSQDRISILFVLQVESRMKLRLHLQMRGNHVRLVNSAAARAADIHFLQGDNIRPAFVDDGSSTDGVELAVGAEATVHVIGEEAYPPSHDLISVISHFWNTRELLFVPVEVWEQHVWS